MKIVEVINSLSLRGGAEVFVYSLVKELAKNPDNEIVLISLFSGVHESFKDVVTDNVHLYTCDKRKGLDLRAAKKLKRIIDDFSPDIVHTHLSCSPSLYLAYGTKKQRWKYVHTVHNMADKESSGVVSWINKKLIKKNIMIPVGISDIVSSSIKSFYGINTIHTVYNGLRLMTDENKSFDERQYDFICVARFYEQKNHLFLLKAFNKYIQNNATSKLVLVGEGNTKEQCKKYCNDQSMKDNVIFTGSISDVSNYLNDSRVLVLSSLFEGNPICILEAMSLGLTVVSSKVGGVPDIIAENQNGFLFESNNEEELLNCLEKSLEKSSWETIRENNKRDIEKYNIESTSLQYQMMFQEIITSN